MGPLTLEVGRDDWPQNVTFNNLYTANTFHIMPWSQGVRLIEMAEKNLARGHLFMIYGPFNYRGQWTSKSNEIFDRSLRQRDPLMGLRDFETLSETMAKHTFDLVADHEMPANNRFLIFQKN